MVSSGVVRKFGLSGTELYRARLLIEKGSRAALNKFLTIYTPVVYLIARQYTLDTRLQREYIRAEMSGFWSLWKRRMVRKEILRFIHR